MTDSSATKQPGSASGSTAGEQMDAVSTIHRVLAETTVQLRKGDILREEDLGGVRVVTVDMMPHVDEAPDIDKIDMEMLVVGVNKAAAERNRAMFIAALDALPEVSRLAGGPSYIEVGAYLGDQGAAFCMFALGKVLGLWNVITPTGMGFTGDEATQMAGMGFVMMTGYSPATTPPHEGSTPADETGERR